MDRRSRPSRLRIHARRLSRGSYVRVDASGPSSRGGSLSLSPGRAILYGTLVVVAIDLMDAIVFFGLRGVRPIRIFHSIAAGLLGRSAFSRRSGYGAARGVSPFLHCAGHRLGLLPGEHPCARADAPRGDLRAAVRRGRVNLDEPGGPAVVGRGQADVPAAGAGEWPSHSHVRRRTAQRAVRPSRKRREIVMIRWR